MKVHHILLSLHSGEALEALKGELVPGDVVVVAPGRALLERYEAILDSQLVERNDARPALKALRNELKAQAGSESFDRFADETIDRIYMVLCQGMSLSFRDNSLTDYLKAFLVRLCADCAAARLGAQASLDGRDFVVCETRGSVPVVDRALTDPAIAALPKEGVTVIAGGFGRKVTGETVSLGPAGSELTANIFGAVLKADAVLCHVPGFRDETLSVLSFEEAAQRFTEEDGPVYPPALIPARKAGVNIEVIGETSLRIVPADTLTGGKGITGIVVSGPMNLLTIYGTGLLGSVGISSAIFGLLADKGINIHFISQSLSEYSISFAVKRTDAARAEEAVRSLISERLTDLSYDDRAVAIVSVFGQRMKHIPGISGRVYSALGNAGVNVVAASQGGEELSISVVVEEADACRAREALTTLKA